MMDGKKILALVLSKAKGKPSGEDEPSSHEDEMAAMVEQFKNEKDPKKAADVFMNMISAHCDYMNSDTDSDMGEESKEEVA